ncbi:hypothetical protein [Microvirga sp. KLBC 81]|uniref:hypothetical protein n=1 Tax=Microvirga sp. KLBC 81 TaxID=1862707 RepID=UPI001402A926|nr:hypothetical protein [Microvirga sp. KLBC 81]
MPEPVVGGQALFAMPLENGRVEPTTGLETLAIEKRFSKNVSFFTYTIGGDPVNMESR